MATPDLFQQAADGKAKFFLQFGGQGSPWYKEVVNYWNNDPEVKKVLEVCVKALEEEHDTVAGTAGLPDGMPIRKWLDDPESLASEDYLSCASVSIPMIQMAQLAHFENLHLKGYDKGKLLDYTAGATGHSQGVITSSLAALGLTGDDYLQAAALYMKYVLYVGVRAQEEYPFFAANADEVAKSAELGAKGTPTPMVAVLGGDHDNAKRMMDEVNADLPDNEKIYISLYNSPSNRIMSSYRGSLIKFHEKHKAYMEENKMKFVYIRTTCPFHCPLMDDIGKRIEPDIERIGFKFTGKDLKVPVYSFNTGDNYQSDDKLPMTLYGDMAIKVLYWDKAVQAVDGNVSHILDFGPGKTSQRLSQDTLKEMGREPTILAAGVPKDLKTLLA